jgi:aldose 1-epimerase
MPGNSVELYTLTNARGVEVRATNNGGIIVSLHVPDERGRLDDVVVGGWPKSDGTGHLS